MIPIKAFRDILLLLTVCVLALSGAAALTEETAAIVFDGDTVSCASDAVSAEDRRLTVRAGGEYVLSGQAGGWQIRVNAPGDSVILRLNGLNLTCDFGPAVWVIAGDAAIVCEEGTSNSLQDTPARKDASDSPSSGVIYAEGALTVSGPLTVTANLGTAVQSKDDLILRGADLTVTAANDGLHGKDSVTVTASSVTIEAAGDGIQAKHRKPEKGNITLTDSTVTITCGKDPLQASGSISSEGCKLLIRTESAE